MVFTIQKLSKRRKKNCGAKLKLTEELSNEIIKRLEKHHSPEQIAGRLKKEKLVKSYLLKAFITGFTKAYYQR